MVYSYNLRFFSGGELGQGDHKFQANLGDGEQAYVKNK